MSNGTPRTPSGAAALAEHHPDPAPEPLADAPTQPPPLPASGYDVLVVGAGPGGLFAALRAQRAPSARVLVVEAGLDVADRVLALHAADGTGRPIGGEDVITTGLGGAGLFSDGKLCLSHRIGSTVSHRFPAADVDARQRWIDEAIRSGEDAPLHGADSPEAAALVGRAKAAGLEYLHYPVRHVGSDQLPRMLGRLRQRLLDAGVTVLCRTRCLTVAPPDTSGGRWRALLTAGGTPFWVTVPHLVLAPGKVGADWMQQLGVTLGLRQRPARPKLGFRLEGPKGSLDPLLAVATDPKLIWKAANRAEARTHCVCYGGDVVAAEYDDLLLVGGHSTSIHHADRSNTAVIAAPGTGQPVTAEEARVVVRRINAAHGGLVAQALGDYLAGRPTTAPVNALTRNFIPSMPHATTGDLGVAYPPAVTAALRSFLPKLGELCPDILHPDNLLYGPAVERWAPRFVVSDDMETALSGLFLVGDGPGLTGGVIGAAETGWLAGDAIAARLTASRPA